MTVRMEGNSRETIGRRCVPGGGVQVELNIHVYVAKEETRNGPGGSVYRHDGIPYGENWNYSPDFCRVVYIIFAFEY